MNITRLLRVWDFFIIACCFLKVASSSFRTQEHKNILNNGISLTANLTLDLTQEHRNDTGQDITLHGGSHILTERRALNTFKIDYENDTFVMNGSLLGN